MIAQYLPTGLRKKRGDALEVVVQGGKELFFYFYFFWYLNISVLFIMSYIFIGLA